jgi:hypothetical protein
VRLVGANSYEAGLTAATTGTDPKPRFSTVESRLTGTNLKTSTFHRGKSGNVEGSSPVDQAPFPCLAEIVNAPASGIVETPSNPSNLFSFRSIYVHPHYIRVSKHHTEVTMSEVLLTTSQAARLLGISVITLRAWHKIGKLVPMIVTPMGWRLYAQSDLEEFKQAREEKEK